jgi:hypothetical protein
MINIKKNFDFIIIQLPVLLILLVQLSTGSKYG